MPVPSATKTISASGGSVTVTRSTVARNRPGTCGRASPAICSALVDRELRNQNGDVAVHHGLTAEPRVQGEAGRRVEAVLLVLLHLREIAIALLHDDVTGGA